MPPQYRCTLPKTADFLTQIRPSNASQKNIIRRVLLFIGFFKIFDRKAFENQHSKCTFAALRADG